MQTTIGDIVPNKSSTKIFALDVIPVDVINTKTGKVEQENRVSISMIDFKKHIFIPDKIKIMQGYKDTGHIIEEGFNSEGDVFLVLGFANEKRRDGLFYITDTLQPNNFDE